MKKLSLFFCLILCFSLLSGCAKNQDKPTRLAFPGLEWGMTKEEVIDALSLQEGEYEID